MVFPTAAFPNASAGVELGPGSALEGTDSGSRAACIASTPCKGSRRTKGVKLWDQARCHKSGAHFSKALALLYLQSRKFVSG